MLLRAGLTNPKLLLVCLSSFNHTSLLSQLCCELSVLLVYFSCLRFVSGFNKMCKCVSVTVWLCPQVKTRRLPTETSGGCFGCDAGLIHADRLLWATGGGWTLNRITQWWDQTRSAINELMEPGYTLQAGHQYICDHPSTFTDNFKVQSFLLVQSQLTCEATETQPHWRMTGNFSANVQMQL